MASSTPKVVKAIRKLRHYKQRFNPNARFVWRRETAWPKKKGKGSTLFPAGSILEDYVIEQMGRAKLARFWEANRIELLEFETPDVLTGTVVDINDPMQVKQAAAKKPKAATKGNGAKKKAPKRKPLSPEKKAEAQAKRAATIARKKAEKAAADTAGGEE